MDILQNIILVLNIVLLLGILVGVASISYENAKIEHSLNILLNEDDRTDEIANLAVSLVQLKERVEKIEKVLHSSKRRHNGK